MVVIEAAVLSAALDAITKILNPENIFKAMLFSTVFLSLFTGIRNTKTSNNFLIDGVNILGYTWLDMHEIRFDDNICFYNMFSYFNQTTVQDTGDKPIINIPFLHEPITGGGSGFG